MTSAVAPTPVAGLPVAPDPDSAESDFDLAAFNWATALGPWTTAMNGLSDNVYNNALAAAESAAAAADSAGAAASASNAAQAAAAASLGAANFKGNWSSLTGALNTPACVKHSGRFWLLLNNLADVTAATPGVSSAWTSLDSGTAPSAVITTNTTAVVGVRYRIAGACTLTVPTGLQQGDLIAFSLMDGVTGAYVDFGATKFQGRDVGLMSLDTPLIGLSMTYENSTLGLCQ